MTMYVEIPGIKGEATEENHKDWIIIQSYSQSVMRNIMVEDLGSSKKGMGKAQWSAIDCVTENSLASPKLMEAVAAGTVFNEVKIHFLRADAAQGADAKPYMTYLLTDAMIASFTTSGSTDMVPTESFSLMYTTIEVEYKALDTKNKEKAKSAVKWDVGKAKAK
ncbi:MAG: type VI secretion system tube protein Hcp [Pseudomonadota bacterium]